MTIWEYSETNSYKKDDICLHSGSMYVALADMNPGPWTAAFWSKIETFKPAINKVVSIIDDKYSSSRTYNKGDFCINNNSLYRCNEDGITGSWDSSKWDITTIGESFEPKPIWELHGTVTADGTSSIIQENFSVPVKGFFVEAKLEESVSDASFGIVAQFNDESNSRRSVGDLSAAITSSVGYLTAKFEQEGNLWLGWITTPSPQYTAGARNTRNDGYALDIEGEIELIEFRTQTTSAVIPENSTFKIYVRR